MSRIKKEVDEQDVIRGYYDLAGAVVKQAINDYKSLLTKKTTSSWVKKDNIIGYRDAREFLFSKRRCTDKCCDGRLEHYLKQMGVENIVKTRMIKKEARLKRESETRAMR